MTNKLTYHLLPTEDASPLGLYSDILYQLEKVENKNDDVKHHHLHLVSDAPIKDGDWFLDIKTNTIHKAISDCSIEHYKKIEFTTDPKLIAEGVLPIDGNTKVRIDLTKEAFKKYPYLSGIDKYNDTYDANEYNRNEWIKKNEIVNFLTEFCNRYNQKDTKKVDVEKLAEQFTGYKKGTLEYNIATINFRSGYNQALQSTGPFSLDGFEKFMNDNYSMFYCSDQGRFAIRILNQFIQSLTPHSKGEMVIEVEMEDWIRGTKENGREVFQKIKLTNGQPTLIFK